MLTFRNKRSIFYGGLTTEPDFESVTAGDFLRANLSKNYLTSYDEWK